MRLRRVLVMPTTAVFWKKARQNNFPEITKFGLQRAVFVLVEGTDAAAFVHH
jgi:hypothetical protein